MVVIMVTHRNDEVDSPILSHCVSRKIIDIASVTSSFGFLFIILQIME